MIYSLILIFLESKNSLIQCHQMKGPDNSQQKSFRINIASKFLVRQQQTGLSQRLNSTYMSKRYGDSFAKHFSRALTHPASRDSSRVSFRAKSIYKEDY